MRPQSPLYLLMRHYQEDQAQKPPLQTLHPWITSSEGQSIAFYLGMILERQQSVVSGDAKKIKVNIRNKRREGGRDRSSAKRHLTPAGRPLQTKASSLDNGPGQQY